MLGRTFAIGGLALLWTLGCVAHVLAADMSLEETEHRTQPVVIVKPSEEGADYKQEKVERLEELERAVEAERHKKRLLELKLKSLRERVSTERKKVGREPVPLTPPSTAQDAGQRSDHPAETHSTKPEGDSHVVREYIWVPEHREGGKLVEGGYRLEQR